MLSEQKCASLFCLDPFLICSFKMVLIFDGGQSNSTGLNLTKKELNSNGHPYICNLFSFLGHEHLTCWLREYWTLRRNGPLVWFSKICLFLLKHTLTTLTFRLDSELPAQMPSSTLWLVVGVLENSSNWCLGERMSCEKAFALFSRFLDKTCKRDKYCQDQWVHLWMGQKYKLNGFGVA